MFFGEPQKKRFWRDARSIGLVYRWKGELFKVLQSGVFGIIRLNLSGTHLRWEIECGIVLHFKGCPETADFHAGMIRYRSGV